MKVLFGWKECPDPPDKSGSRRRASTLLAALNRAGHDVRLVHFADPGDEGGVPRPRSFRRKMQDWVAPGTPIFRPNYESRLMRRELRSAALESDFAILGQDQMAIFRDEVPLPCYLDATDAWTLVMDSLIGTEPTGFRRRYLVSHRNRIERHIRTYYHRFDGVMVVSQRDADVLEALDPRIRTVVLPHAIDTDSFRDGEESSTATVVYAGVMNHAPNADGAVRFVKEAWPLVRATFPDARLNIVGRSPRSDVSALATDDVVVTGTVPSMAPYLAEAWVAVCPMWSGAGMKTKVLEAMAASTPVVSTTEGVAGMPGAETAGVDVSDDPEVMARRIIRLLRSRELRRERGRSLREFVEHNFSWNRTVARVDALLGANETVAR